MSEWIKDLENYTKEHTHNYEEGDLISSDDNTVDGVDYEPRYDANEITLQGDFTIEKLEALVTHMKQYKGK